MLDGGTRFEVACVHCAMRLMVDRIRDTEATAMADHLRERHHELHLGEASPLGAILDHYCVSAHRTRVASCGACDTVAG